MTNYNLSEQVFFLFFSFCILIRDISFFQSKHNVLLPLQLMKKKQLILNLFFATALLFSIVFQSFHGYEHLEKKISEKVCYHKHNSNRAELTHQHKGFDHCLLCEFTAGVYVSPKDFSCQLYAAYQEIPYFFKATEAVLSFSGSLYSHRGPPVNSVS